MAFVGLLYAVAAPIQTEADGQAITYGKGQVIGGMMTAEISYTIGEHLRLIGIVG